MKGHLMSWELRLHGEVWDLGSGVQTELLLGGRAFLRMVGRGHIDPPRTC